MWASLAVVALLTTGVGEAHRWGHEPYGPPTPLDVAIQPGGNYYIADNAGGAVVELDAQFQPTGRRIAAPNVTGLDVDAANRLAIVTGGAGGTLAVVNADGTEAFHVGGNEVALFEDALGVTWGPAGNLFVFDAGAGNVKVFDNTGKLLFTFGDYTWSRSYDSKKQKRRVTADVADHLNTPCRGDFLPDGRLIIADYDGPVIDPEIGRNCGAFTVWSVDVAAQQATFEKFLPPDHPYPDFKAGDVYVDDHNGRIYTVESDFPLTDHDFVRVQDDVNTPPRFATNYFPFRFLTHPRAVTLSAGGDVVVAEADKGLIFSMPRSLFDTPAGEAPLDWPKVLRTPVCERNRVVLEYRTVAPIVSRVRFSPLVGDWYEYPAGPDLENLREVSAPARDSRHQPLAADQPALNHRITLDKLEPGQRYICQYLLSEHAWPGPLWSEPFIVTTQPPEKKTQYIDAEVIVLVFTNLVKPPADNAMPEPADPGPMSAADIEALQYRMEVARQYYWINSAAHCNLRYTYVFDDTRYPDGPVPNWGYWPDADHRAIDAILAEHGVDHNDMAGLCAIYGYREWNAKRQAWVFSTSGGNTWGSCHDGSGMNTINAGGDTAWLFAHEYGHSMSINYLASCQYFHFNHFRWNYYPADYGEHWNGMAAMLREFSDVAYWALKYGRVVCVDDADEDGLPDNDPRCPLDEVRFGSDPTKADTDGDRLSDLEELMSTTGLQHYAQAFDMRQIEPIYDPNPAETDSDGDGIADGDDKYPVYPWQPTVYEAHVTVDGAIADDEWPTQGFRREMQDAAITGELRLAWDHDYLYVGVIQNAPPEVETPAQLYVQVDGNNDGFTVSGDNIALWVTPKADGTAAVRTQFNDTIIRLKPTWTDNILPSPEDVKAAWGTHDGQFHLEVAIPRTKDACLDLIRFEELGLLFYLTPANSDQTLRLFEPQELFDVVLR